ncbi:MAG: phospholipase A [bacterium]|nr:MAG: phospholipase A [bacterium]
MQAKSRSPAPLFLAALLALVLIPSEALSREDTALERRLSMEKAARDNPFLLLPHRPNFILPAAYSPNPNAEVLGLAPDDLDHVEIIFQVSLKLMISEGFAGTSGDLYAAYTNQSWWQAYNTERSSPFRETNHEPELFLLFNRHRRIPGFTRSWMAAGLSHQSNGQEGDLSRSWNRLYLNLFLERDGLVVSIKPWLRIPERKKEFPGDPRGDDNPDITEYMGNGELGIVLSKNRHNFTLLVRNNFRSDNKGAVRLGWSYPITTKVKGYFQLFDGYGESLIDYDHRITRVGLGILLADWL